MSRLGVTIYTVVKWLLQHDMLTARWCMENRLTASSRAVYNSNLLNLKFLNKYRSTGRLKINLAKSTTRGVALFKDIYLTQIGFLYNIHPMAGHEKHESSSAHNMRFRRLIGHPFLPKWSPQNILALLPEVHPFVSSISRQFSSGRSLILD